MTDQDLPPGGVLVDPPRLILANLRPFAVALLLLRGTITRYELEATVVPHANIDDLKVGSIDPFDGTELDGTRLEYLVDQVLRELASEGVIRWAPSTNNWVLSTDSPGKIIQWAITTNAALPAQIRQYVYEDILEELGDPPRGL